MPNQFEGNFTTTPTKKIAIVVGKFNESVTRNLADGAIRTLKQFGIKDDQIDLVWVPGAFEIAFAAKKLVESGNYAGVMTDTIEQAMQRAGLKVGNEGSMTAQSLLEMISLNEQLG